MKKRTISLIIGVVVICLLGGVYFGLRSYNSKQEEAQEEASEGESVLLIDPDDIQEVSFDIDEEPVSFRKEESGEWKKTDDETFPVDSSMILYALDTVADLRSERTLKDPEDPSEYGLQEPQQEITLTDENGEETVLSIGDSNAVTGNDYLILNQDTSVVYTVGEGVRDAFSYGLYEYAVSEELPYLSASEITGIQTKQTQGEGYSLSLKDGVWYVSEEKADADMAKSLAESATELTYESYLDHNCTDLSLYGLDDPWASLTITWQEPLEDEEESGAYSYDQTEQDSEEETETLYIVNSETWQIGQMDDYLDYYVQLEGSTEVHTIDGSLISELFGYTSEDLAAQSGSETETEKETENK